MSVLIPAAAVSTLSVLPAAVPQGLPLSDKWPLLQTLGVFVGIPVAAMAVICALVMLRSGARGPSGSGDAVTAVFSGPYAGQVDAGPSGGGTGTGPVTETGEDSGMHRQVAQPAGPDGGSSNSSGEVTGDEQRAAGTGSGGAGAHW